MKLRNNIFFREKQKDGIFDGIFLFQIIIYVLLQQVIYSIR